MKNLITAIIVSALFIGAYIAYDVFVRNPREAKENAYWRDKSFKPDTTIIEKFTNTVRGNEAVPPATVNYYSTTDDSKNARILQLLDSALKVIDTLTKRDFTIKKEYITQYPTSNKLIRGKFTKDSLQLDLLGIDGKLKTEYYPADYSHFDYYYQNNSLRASERITRTTQIKSKRAPIFRYDGMYINYEQGLINPSKTAEAIMGVDLWKLRISGFGRYNIQNQDPAQKNKANAGFKLGVKLF
jgi:hypothetical protein